MFPTRGLIDGAEHLLASMFHRVRERGKLASLPVLSG